MKRKFYDMKKRRSVTKNVTHKKKAKKKGRTTYMLLCEIPSEDRFLYSICSKDDYDDADVPVTR